MFGTAGQAAARGRNLHGTTLGRVVDEIAKENMRIAKRRSSIGMLTDPHHVAKIMKRKLFYNLKAEVEGR